jgi:hypothetical protein
MLTVKEIIKKGLPVDAFPDPIKNFIIQFARGSGSQESFVASGVLACCAGVCGHHEIIVKNGYKERPNFFLCLVGKPGVTKSAPIKAALKPMLIVEAKNSKEFKEAHEKWKALLKDKGLKKAERDAIMASQPTRKPCHVITDGSIEAMFQHLEAMDEAGGAPHCVFVKDELKAFFGGMDKFKGKGGDEYETWLSLFSGQDLIKTLVSKTIFIKGARATVIGGIQPDVYNKCMKDKGDGMTDRFMIAIFEGDPVMTDIRQFCEVEALKNYEEFMTEISDSEPITFSLWKCLGGEIEREKVLDMVQDFHKWAHDLGVIYETGAFKKWEQCLYRLIIVMAAIWQKPAIDSFVVKKAIELSAYYASDWLRAKLMSDKSTNDVIFDKIKGLLKKSELRRREIQQKLHIDKNKTISLLHEMLEDGDIILVGDFKSQKESSYIYALKGGSL